MQVINNIIPLDNFLEFKEGSYYKFIALKRGKDFGDTGSVLLKNWFVDSEKSYEEHQQEMMELGIATGARIYVTLDRKNVHKTLTYLVSRFTNMLIEFTRGVRPTIKTIAKQINIATSVVDTSDIKTTLIDIDTKDSGLIAIFEKCFEDEKITILPTKQGYHIALVGRFNIDEIYEKASDIYCKHFFKEGFDFWKYYHDNVTINNNQLGLVYMYIDKN